MYRFVFLIFLCLGNIGILSADAPGEVWVSRARIVGGQNYFTSVMQELCYELERREWSNLKLIDVIKNFDAIIANWHINGTATYTNGFVISIQKIDVSSFTSSVSRVIEDDVVIPSASVRGRLHFRHINIGYDVIADIQNIGVQRYTGEIMNNNIGFDFSIIRNVITNVTTVTSSISVLEGSQIRMIYSPADHLTQVLSRNFVSSDNWWGAAAWRDNFVQIITDIVNNKISFPRLCFNDC